MGDVCADPIDEEITRSVLNKTPLTFDEVGVMKAMFKYYDTGEYKPLHTNRYTGKTKSGNLSPFGLLLRGKGGDACTEGGSSKSPSKPRGVILNEEFSSNFFPFW